MRLQLRLQFLIMKMCWLKNQTHQSIRNANYTQNIIPMKYLKKIKSRIRRWKFKIRRKLSRAKILPANQTHDLIGSLIKSKTPAAIGKIGSTELMGLKNLKLHQKDPTHLQGPKGRRIIHKLYRNSGVFPENESTYPQFCDIYTESLSKMTLLAPWFPKGELRIIKRYAQQAVLISDNPLFLLPMSPDNMHHWTHHLKGKTILAIHPFTQTISKQFQNRSKIWPGKDPFLPESTLKTLKVPLYDAS
jgi:hypothetical protein